MEIEVGSIVSCTLGTSCIVESIEDGKYLVKDMRFNFTAIYKKEDLRIDCREFPKIFHETEIPNFVVVDRFYKDPLKIRDFALQQEFFENIKYYKGKRSRSFLFPNIKERFEKLLGVKIINWLDPNSANGCFQITSSVNNLVFHSDKLAFAAAIYLTPDAEPNSGTSFWRDKTYKCRTSPFNILERDKFENDEERSIAHAAIYNNETITNAEHWELVDRVSPLFNRLVLWNGRLIHSATNYDNFVSDDPEKSRLVQLFFFDIET